MQGLVIVAHASGRFIQIECDDRQLLRQLVMIHDRVFGHGKREQRIGAAVLRVAGHGRSVRAGDDDFSGKRGAPLFQYHAPLIVHEMGPPTGVRPHGDSRDGLPRHPARVGALRGEVDCRASKRDRHRGNQAPLQTLAHGRTV